MENFYSILGIPFTADSTQIRTAYKKMAMEYHPDRNPQKPGAEDMFKKINEAYHTLSDPLKKLCYDSQITLLPLYSSEYELELKRRRIRYWYWKKRQEKQYYYKLDKEYFRNQALAFLVFIVISGFFFAIVHTADYIMEQKHLARWQENSVHLQEVNSLFGEGHFDDAFSMIESLKKEDPYEFRFIYARDSLVNVLRGVADHSFDTRDFSRAVSYYLTLQNLEQPVRDETMRKVSLCQYFLGNFREAVQALKHLHNQRPWDLELVYSIGLINLEDLENTEEALHYFTLGKKLFKHNLTQVYGAAFETIVNPTDVPDVYYEIFEARARANLITKNYSEAVTDCNWAVFLRPLHGLPYAMRATAYAELNRPDKVCPDLQAAERLGQPVNKLIKRKFCRRTSSPER